MLLKSTYPHAYVKEVSDGAELLLQAGKEQWDLIISDISMPGRTGGEVIKDLNTSFPHIPILILSTHPAEQYAIRTLKMGASGYLTKESAPEELIKAVEYMLTGKKYITPEVADIIAESMSVYTEKPLHEGLSEREYEVFKHISAGKTVSEISTILSLSINTISTYRARLLQKLLLHNNADLVKYAIEHKLFQN